MKGPMSIMKRKTSEHGQALYARTCLNCGFEESYRPGATTEVVAHLFNPGPQTYMCAACRLEIFADCICESCDYTRKNKQYYESVKARCQEDQA